MKNVLIITSQFNEQDSVVTISRNILEIYKKILTIKLKTLVIEKLDLNTTDISDFDFIVFIHPSAIVSANANNLLVAINPQKTSILFYLFGDYVRKSYFYLKLNDLLVGKKVHFFVASKSYLKLVQKSLSNKYACTVCPFPINLKNFKLNSLDRANFRQKHSFVKNDIVLTYTGRLSPQKNVLLLINTFKKVKQFGGLDTKLKLLIIGNIDDFEAPTFYETKINPGDYYQLLRAEINLDPSIIHLPRLEITELRKAYAATDLFISLSLYHDEDFGYSPLEALCMGTPLLVTNWGGYRDLINIPGTNRAIELLAVEYKNDSLLISQDELVDKLLISINKKRIQSSKLIKIRKKNSLFSIMQSYEKQLDTPFEVFAGFSENFFSLSLSILCEDHAGIKDYAEFYNSFWSN